MSCLDWSNDGSKLFSADASGLVMMTLVDFENVRLWSCSSYLFPSPG